MRRPHQQGSAQKQQGLSLVELMIALVLGLVLSAGVFQVFTNSSQTYQLSDSLSNMQENLRFAIGRLQYETRMAGYKGCLIGQPFDNLDSGDDDYLTYVYGGQPVAGWDAAGTDLGEEYANTDFDPENTSLAGSGLGLFPEEDEVLPGSDVLVVNNASAIDVTLTGNPQGPTANTIGTDGASDIEQDQILLVVTGDCTWGDVFQHTNATSGTLTKGSGNAPGNTTPDPNGFEGRFGDDATVYDYTSTAFFISRRDANSPPSLYMRRLDAGDPFGNVELVEGVENMQVLYGITNAGGETVVNYVSAENVGNWANVASVRIALLLRSDDGVQDGGREEGEANVGRVYNLLGTQVTTEADERARMVGTLTVGIRNRLE